MRIRSSLFAVVVATGLGSVLAIACGGSSLKEAGEECVASSECATGLACDLGQTPHVCAQETTVPPDAAPVPIDGPPVDGDVVDGAPIDTPPPIDAMPIDAMPPDAMIDAAAPDAMPPDAMPPDAMPPDA
ncbi:MAG: hypothetical protein H6709_18965 [Kofleriaceae bacterium]|nr:hypothetical protein [Myxococcales bacterium]MCB9564827.1 hypothetical protein [Kofleriaceae bacterium]MCB9574171.1 hypothetical protein [Kofleriaceae bacterium]